VNRSTIKKLIGAVTEIKTPFSLEYKYLNCLPKSVKFSKNQSKIRKFANLMQKPVLKRNDYILEIDNSTGTKGSLCGEIETEETSKKLRTEFKVYTPSNCNELNARKSTSQLNGLRLESFMHPAISSREKTKGIKTRSPLLKETSHTILIAKKRIIKPNKNTKVKLSSTQNLPYSHLAAASDLLKSQESSLISTNLISRDSLLKSKQTKIPSKGILPMINDNKVPLECVAKKHRMRNVLNNINETSFDIIKSLGNKKKPNAIKSRKEVVDIKEMRKQCNIDSKENIILVPVLKIQDLERKLSVASIAWLGFSPGL